MFTLPCLRRSASAALILATALGIAAPAILAEPPLQTTWLADYPQLLQARERQARLLRHLPPGQISFEDTATYSRTTIEELPAGFHHLRIDSEAEVQAALAALAPYLALTAEDRFDLIVPGPTGPMSQTWLALSTPNGHLMLNRVLVLATEQDTGELRGIQGMIDHAARLPTEPTLSADRAIEYALAAMGDRSAWAEDGHGAYPVYLSGSPACLVWQVMLAPALAETEAEAVELTVFVLGDGTVNRDRGLLICPSTPQP